MCSNGEKREINLDENSNEIPKDDNPNKRPRLGPSSSLGSEAKKTLTKIFDLECDEIYDLLLFHGLDSKICDLIYGNINYWS